ncbi:acyl carrier protein [Winogradskya humida]|uniref:Carrier domain-containing protein n=1 Tax=Winogradskya humida TaxID=113566 RepID=A0ABQ4A100_9ACTN|nr:phosphopantetheine-binding protein [Actinoplanes humidus]GIE24535.1 hypothetical protein Ahu01nite_076370 [Actinoplanes humidus]
MRELTQQVAELVARNARAGTGDDGADLDTPLRDRGVDSLTVAGVIVDIERTFGVRFPAALITADTFTSVRSVAAAVEELTRREQDA